MTNFNFIVFIVVLSISFTALSALPVKKQPQKPVVNEREPEGPDTNVSL